MRLFQPMPIDRQDDEARILARYKDIGWDFLRVGMPLGAIAYFLDIKWVVAYGFFIVAFSLGAIDARLHDIIIRFRRMDQERRQNSN